MIFKKCQSPLFDSFTKRSDIVMPICLKCSDIPLDLWYLDNFKEIGNVLGTFLEADMLFLDIGIMFIGYILVGFLKERSCCRDDIAKNRSYLFSTSRLFKGPILVYLVS
jgi:hypothetical protein